MIFWRVGQPASAKRRQKLLPRLQLKQKEAMTLQSVRVVPVVPAREAAAPSRAVATHHLRPHRIRPIRVQGDAVEVAIGDAIAGV